MSRRLLILLLILSPHIYCQKNQDQEIAVFAGGCFWCMQPPYDRLKGKGVVRTVVGYTGGDVKHPSYDQVSSGITGHVEAVKVIYQPSIISYERLLKIYWRNIDPTVKNRQFCDIGEQYRSVIFYANARQKKIAERSKMDLMNAGIVPVVFTEIVPLGAFYPAEESHQEYYKKHPFKYRFYRYRCGRDKRLKEVWGESKNPVLAH